MSNMWDMLSRYTTKEKTKSKDKKDNMPQKKEKKARKPKKRQPSFTLPRNPYRHKYSAHYPMVGDRQWAVFRSGGLEGGLQFNSLMSLNDRIVCQLDREEICRWMTRQQDLGARGRKTGPPPAPMRSPQTKLSTSSDSTFSQDTYQEHMSESSYSASIPDYDRDAESGYHTPEQQSSELDFPISHDPQVLRGQRHKSPTGTVSPKRAFSPTRALSPSSDSFPPPPPGDFSSRRSSSSSVRSMPDFPPPPPPDFSSHGSTPLSPEEPESIYQTHIDTFRQEPIIDQTYYTKVSDGFGEPDNLYGTTLPMPVHSSAIGQMSPSGRPMDLPPPPAPFANQSPGSTPSSISPPPPPPPPPPGLPTSPGLFGASKVPPPTLPKPPRERRTPLSSVSSACSSPPPGIPAPPPPPPPGVPIPPPPPPGVPAPPGLPPLSIVPMKRSNPFVPPTPPPVSTIPTRLNKGTAATREGPGRNAPLTSDKRTALLAQIESGIRLKRSPGPKIKEIHQEGSRKSVHGKPESATEGAESSRTPANTAANRSSQNGSIPTNHKPGPPAVSTKPEIRNMPVFNQQSPKPKPTANSSTEIEIGTSASAQRNKEIDEKIKNLNPTTLPGYQSIPDNCPGWKVAMIEKKNSDLVEKAKDELLKQKAEEDKWKDVPDWRKALIQKKEEKKQQEEAGHMEQKKKEDERNARLQAMPEWKRKIILKKSGDEL